MKCGIHNFHSMAPSTPKNTMKDQDIDTLPAHDGVHEAGSELEVNDMKHGESLHPHKHRKLSKAASLLKRVPKAAKHKAARSGKLLSRAFRGVIRFTLRRNSRRSSSSSSSSAAHAKTQPGSQTSLSHHPEHQQTPQEAAGNPSSSSLMTGGVKSAVGLTSKESLGSVAGGGGGGCKAASCMELSGGYEESLSSPACSPSRVPHRRKVLGELITPATRLGLQVTSCSTSSVSPVSSPAGSITAASHRTADHSSTGALLEMNSKEYHHLTTTSGNEEAGSRVLKCESEVMLDKTQAAALSTLQDRLRETPGMQGMSKDLPLLRRFAATRQYHVDDTLHLLHDYHRWREEMQLDSVSEEDVRRELRKKHVLVLPGSTREGRHRRQGAVGMPNDFCNMGRDATNHPVIYKCMANLERHPSGSTKEVDLVHAFLFDRVAQALDVEYSESAIETFTVLLDLTASSNRLDTKSFGRVSNILKVGFRGRLHRLYIFPAGRLERLAFNTLKHFFGRNTRHKVVMIPPSKKHELLALIPKDVLPAHLGGTSRVMCTKHQTASADKPEPQLQNGTSDSSIPILTNARIERPIPDREKPSRVASTLPSSESVETSRNPSNPISIEVEAETRRDEIADTEMVSSSASSQASTSDEDENGYARTYMPEWASVWPPEYGKLKKMLNASIYIAVMVAGAKYGFDQGYNYKPQSKLSLRVRRKSKNSYARPFKLLSSVTPAVKHGLYGMVTAGALLGTPQVGICVGVAYVLGRHFHRR